MPFSVVYLSNFARAIPAPAYKYTLRASSFTVTMLLKQFPANFEERETTTPRIPLSPTSILVPSPSMNSGTFFLRMKLNIFKRSSSLPGNTIASEGPPILKEVCLLIGSSKSITPLNSLIKELRLSCILVVTYYFPPNLPYIPCTECNYHVPGHKDVFYVIIDFGLVRDIYCIPVSMSAYCII